MAEPEISGLEPVAWIEDAFKRAFDTGASDIFISVDRPDDGLSATVIGKLRIDGVMVEIPRLLGVRANEVANKIKQEAGITTGSMIEPSEGRYLHKRTFTGSDGSQVTESLQIRVTAYPEGEAGEFLSLRIPPTGPVRTLSQLGFLPANLERLNECINKPGGLTALAGPMGSGKTTTLYAAVLQLGGPDKSVLTVEDPKERTLPGAHQLEINPMADGGGMTYPRVLKSLMRVVLDVLLIGEIRDHDTAEAALRIATAGTRVLSSIHANDPVTAIHKIISYSEQSVINTLSGVSGIAAQRMLRNIHHHCKGTGIDPATGRSCVGCSGIGYRGKSAIHEILVNSQEITEAFMKGRSHTEITRLSREAGMMTFHEAARPLLEQKITTESEIISVLGYPVEDRNLPTVVPMSAPPVDIRPSEVPTPIAQRPSTPAVPQVTLPARTPASEPQAPSRPQVRLPLPAQTAK